MSLGLPLDLTWYKLLTDWGSLIGGIFALIAGAALYIIGRVQAKAITLASDKEIAATREGVDRQLAVAAQREQLQARCIAVGIAPELEALRIAHKNSDRMIDALAELNQSTSMVAHKFLSDACIEIPPILARNVDHFYLLGDPAGPTMLQLVSVTLQYNHMIDTLAQELKEHPHTINPSKHKKDFAGHLKSLVI
jgi:hypothetical protein